MSKASRSTGAVRTRAARWLAAVLLAGWAAAACGRSAPAGVASPIRAPGTPAAVADDAPAGEDAKMVAAHLGAVEVAIRDPATPPAAVDGLGGEEQSLYAALARHPEWDATVLAAVPARVRPAVEANLTAARELSELAGTPSPELPHWRIVAPAPAAQLLGYYRAAAAATGVPWQYLAAIHLVETRMGRIRGNSTAGAQGPMQFLPSTWAVYGQGGDINSDRDAIAAAARMLRSRGAPADMAGALHAYNPSAHYVRAVSAYAGVMAADERTYPAYRAWQVYYGDRLLPEGWAN